MAETIFALGTGGGRAAIAVMRLSGERAGAVLREVAGQDINPRRARLSVFRDPDSGEALDQGLALWFPAPHSVTGEDYAEFHLHGGRAVIDGFLSMLGRRAGLRPAEPGEFARRGFANGKLDLSQAEALADLIDAQTEFQRRQAIRVAGGELRRRVEDWRRSVLEAQALVEAELDFSDEQDVAEAPRAALDASLAPCIAQMREALRAAPASERMREGFVVFILGPPNAGKSTLLNALAQRDVAIVSEIPGTTRDLIEVHLDLGGAPVTFVDTAGLREASDEIEKIGINRVLQRMQAADLLLWLSESGEVPPPAQAGGRAADIIRLASKCDLYSPPPGVLGVSAKTGAGLETLFERIAERARRSLGDGSSALLIRERHRESVSAAAAALESARATGRPLELVAEDLRVASRALGRIVGAIGVEEILGAIFSRFCIGK